MTSRSLHFLAAALVTLTSFASPARADTDFGQVAIYVARMLENTHYSHQEFDNEMSSKLLENYLDFLDARHNFFTQEDVDGFRKDYKETLDDYVMLRDISPAIKIYDVYKQRVKERVEFVKKTLEKPNYTFDSDRTVDLKREKLPWPKDKAASDDLWRNLIESEMLQENMIEEAKIEKEAKKAAEKEKKAKDAPKKADAEAKAESKGPDVAKTTPKKDEDEKPEQRVLKDYERLLESINDNDNEEIVNFFLSCLATAYDPHTEYMSTNEMENFNIQMKHQLFGIGALLGIKDDVAEIQGIVMGGPADKQGELKLNDKILAVAQGDYEWVSTKNLRLQKIVEMIRGKQGSTVNLKVQPADDPTLTTEITIVRGEVALKDKLANAELIKTPTSEGNSLKVGWIYLSSFYADMQEGKVSTTADVERLLRRLMKEGIDGLVFDLRGNGGGSLEEAIRLTGLFIPSGPVVQVKDWKDDVTFRECTNERPLYDGPMIVLTDKASASASEIFAAALQDYRRAVIIGDKSTYGKGTVQTIQDVEKFMPFFADKSRAGSLKVTIQKFYRIAGGSTQLKGVVPDLQLPSLRDAMDFGEGSQKNALPYDEINALTYTPFRKDAFPVDELKARMNSRVKGNPDFTYILDEADRLKKRLDRDTVSLNKKTREQERKDNEARRDKYEADREKRAKEVAEKLKTDSFKVYHLTLDNVDKTELVPESAFTLEQSTGIRASKRDDDDSAPEGTKFPYAIEPAKLETINVIRDMIDLSKGTAATAKTEDKK
jgi:carboxyl-terminal processing protease